MSSRNPALSIPVLLIAVLSTGFQVYPQSAQDSSTGGTVYSVSVDLVKVPISVFDKDGDVIQHLRRDDFILYEDTVRQQIRSFGVDVNPVSVVLVIDTSATVEKELKKIKEAAEGFAQALTRDDRISVITFSDEADLLLDWTTEGKRVRKALKKAEPGLRTALYDAMYKATGQLRGVEGRKAIILLTDGLNNQSSIGWQQASQAIIQSQASLYVVSKTLMVREAARKERRVVILSDIYRRLFGDADYIDEYFSKKEAEMTALAENTGGRCFFPTDYDQVKGVYYEVARELKSKYFLTYVSNQPKKSNSYHRISLVYLPPSGKLTYRKGYFFKPDPIPVPPRLQP